MRQSIRGLVEQRLRRERINVCTDELLAVSTDSGIISSGPAMADVLDTVRRVAPHFRSVLVQGETGTGKELVARALHRLSGDKPGPFVVCNAAAITETLAESELFGHVKGSFTGATTDKVGLFEAAHGGILFLDEIGEMPLSLQAKLLRAIQSQEIQRVGSTTVRKIDVKIVAATNRNLAEEVHAKRFREDLYYRLSSIEILIPALRNRGEDLHLLIRHFIKRYSTEYKKDIRGLTRRAENALRLYRWPGNVRELENVISHAVMRADGAYVDLSDLPSKFRSTDGRSANLLSIDDVVRTYIQDVISRFGGNKQRAAEALNISRSTLYRMLSDDNREAAEVSGTLQ
ncbi:MAG: sigma-54-dependent Fis family transcriptional regulator [Acidobacteriales bacterium]|nr:sigma-54-dependent Fis family transcriptional regulator [Terriglobales bacterium]